MNDDLFCQECGKKLDPIKAVWLELSTETGEYYFGDPLPEAESQGGFPFGKDCAKKIGKRYQAEKESSKPIENGSRISFKPEYGDPGEAFIVSQWDGRRGWAGDLDGRGWYFTADQVNLIGEEESK